MIKFKVGDKVRIKNNLDFIDESDSTKDSIAKLEGEIATITSVDSKGKYCYQINLDDGEYNWKEDDFEEIKLPIQVRYIDKNLTKMEKIDKGDLVDLRVSKVKVNGEEKEFPCTYKFGDTVFFKLGFALKLPQGYKANVYPRSSTFKNYGLLLTNSVGQIDNSYSGDGDEWCAMFYATRNGVINYDDRILQFEISPQQMNSIAFEFVEELDETNRGGYGSTGTK